jgi:hypothetical protein
MHDKIIELYTLDQDVVEAVQQFLKQHFVRPAGELIDELRDMLEDAQGYTALERQVLQNLMDVLDEALQQEAKFLDAVESASCDHLSGAIGAASIPFTKLLQDHGIGPNDEDEDWAPGRLDI